MRELEHLRILIVEDEIFIASDLAYYFEQKGASILGPAPTIEAAHRHVPSANAAILDVNINGMMVFSIADRLLEQGVPFVFFTRYEDVIPAHLRHIEKVSKYESHHVLLDRLCAACFRTDNEIHATGASPTDEIVDLIPSLRLTARQFLAGRAAADRLVEHTLLAAIQRVGDKPRDEDTLTWLCAIMASVFNALGRTLVD